jgi:uncharacterized protein YkwD
MLAALLAPAGGGGGLLGPAAEAQPPTAVLVFPAAAGRLDTGVFVARGETVKINADGEWTMWAGHYGLSNALGHRYRQGVYFWGQLMARVGGGGEIAIGTGRSFAASDSGELILYPNTGDLGIPAGDGQLTITIWGGRPVSAVVAELSAAGQAVTVPAAGEGVITDLWVEAGQPLRVDAFGQWRMFDGGPLLGPEGDPRRNLADGTAWGRLTARVGGPSFADSEPVSVGAQSVWRPTTSGLLALQAAVGEYAGHPREGSLTVIVRGAQPATEAQKAAAERAAQDRQRLLACLRLRQYRRHLRLGELAASPALMKAAQAHAEYLAAAGRLGHDEQPTVQGYTGVGAFDRAVDMGFRGRLLNEGIHGYTDGLMAIDGLWNTIHQRLALTDPTANVVGVGVAKGAVAAFVVLTGSVQAPATKPTVRAKQADAATWPADGEVGATTRWSGLEEPSALPAGATGPFGPPLSLTILSGEIERLEQAVLLDGHDRPLPTYALGPELDPGHHTVCLVPQAPLATDESFTCRFKVIVGGVARTADWRFSTGSGTLSPFVAPRLGDPANPTFSLDRANH